MDGIEATQRISFDRSVPETRIIAMTTFEQDEYAYSCIKAGASGFVLKSISPENLLALIRVVAGGEALASPVQTIALIEEFVSRPAGNVSGKIQALDALSAQELDVLQQVAKGLSNAEITDLVGVSQKVTKALVESIQQKLDGRDRAQLVVISYESGLVSPD
jgi:DNA-binding NarL/FixJ family response regulator